MNSQVCPLAGSQKLLDVKSDPELNNTKESEEFRDLLNILR
jgi:hypothetical protein